MANRSKLKKKKTTTITKLSQDLTVEILSRLPVKTLTRFKAVSKDFNSISDDPIFLQPHRLQSQNNPYSVRTGFSFHTSTLFLDTFNHQHSHINFFRKQITIDNNHNKPIGKYNSLRDNPITHLLPSNHHLVCIALVNKDIYICNPSTGDFLLVPRHFFSTTKGRRKLGFGYLPSKKEYKLVKLDNYEARVEIFEMTTPSNHLGSSSWIRRFSMEICQYVVVGDPVSINGYLIWKRQKRDGKLLSFNMEKEKFEILTAPPSVIKNGSEFELAGIRGELWLVEHCLSSTVIELWVLKDFRNQNSWMQKCKIDCSRISDKHISARGMHPLDLRNEEEILFRIDPYGLGWYNLRYKIITNWIWITEDGFRLCYYTDGFLAN